MIRYTDMTVAFIYGFSEGEWHGRQFREALQRRGYDIVQNPREADIIIAHSGGCYYVPLDLRNDQAVVLINPTYWPGKSLAKRCVAMMAQMVRAIRRGNHPMYQLHKTARNIGYLLTQTARNHAIAQRAHRYELPVEVKHPNTILVRNRRDPWLTPDLSDLQQLNPHLRIRELDGEHDDCWLHPEPYINLIQS